MINRNSIILIPLIGLDFDHTASMLITFVTLVLLITLVTLITSQEERRAQAAQDEASHELKADDVQVNLQIIIFISLNMVMIIITLVWDSSLSLNVIMIASFLRRIQLLSQSRWSLRPRSSKFSGSAGGRIMIQRIQS